MPWLSKAGEPAYIQFAERAIGNEKLFNTFKSQMPWMYVVGTGEQWHAMQCAKSVSKVPEVQANLETFGKNDTIGLPETLKMKNGSPIGFDTIRFAENVSYLFKTFGDLTGKRITEFGSNYGGMSYCLLSQWSGVSAYHCIDLPQIQTFQRSYLSKLGFEHSALKYEEPTEQANIFISEYALTEFTPEDRTALYEKYCKNADGFLLRANIPDPKEEHTFFEMLRATFKVQIIPEPVCRKVNKLVLGTR